MFVFKWSTVRPFMYGFVTLILQSIICIIWFSMENYNHWINCLSRLPRFLKFCVVLLSVELHRPGHHGGADLHRFPAAVVRLGDQPARSRPAAPVLRVRPGRLFFLPKVMHRQYFNLIVSLQIILISMSLCAWDIMSLTLDFDLSSFRRRITLLIPFGKFIFCSLPNYIQHATKCIIRHRMISIMEFNNTSLNGFHITSIYCSSFSRVSLCTKSLLCQQDHGS